MKIDVLTLFPDMLEIPLQQSILGKARETGHISISIHDIRAFTTDRHHTADDIPYGGGEGMVMKAGPVFDAVESVRSDESTLILLSPQGERFQQKMAEELALLPHLVFICGHYEGVDERVRTGLAPREISLGDFIASGGEFPVLVIIDVICRLVPGVVGNEHSLLNESFSGELLDFPTYTRPQVFRGMRVPDVLLSGHHENIRRWRRRESLRKTLLNRPDLLDKATLSREDLHLLQQLEAEQNKDAET